MHDEIIADLRTTYDRAVEERENKPVRPWKLDEHFQSLSLRR